MRCGCALNSTNFAGMWTNAGIPTHVHWDGSTAAGGPDGTTSAHEAQKWAAQLIAVGWLKRGW